MFWEPLLLGLSSGTFCFVHCGPVALPFFLGEEAEKRENSRLFLLFITGRLAGSIMIGLVIGALGAYAIGYVEPAFRQKLSAVTWILAGLLLIITSITRLIPKLTFCKVLNNHKNLTPRAGSLLLGLVTGLNLCPPFLAAAARVFGKGGTLYGGVYFFLFFIGTSVYLLPLLGIPFLGKIREKLVIIARLTALMLGIYFTLFYGLFELIS